MRKRSVEFSMSQTPPVSVFASFLLLVCMATVWRWWKMTKRKKKLKIDTSIISVCLHSCNPIVASEKTPKKLKTQSSLFSPFPEHKQSQRDVIDRVERQVENIIFPFQNTCSPPSPPQRQKKVRVWHPIIHTHCFSSKTFSQSLGFSKNLFFKTPNPNPHKLKYWTPLPLPLPQEIVTKSCQILNDLEKSFWFQKLGDFFCTHKKLQQNTKDLQKLSSNNQGFLAILQY